MDNTRNTVLSPFNIETLERQTLGDRALQADILGLFINQAERTRDIMAANPDSSVALSELHRFKGAAQSVGAETAADEANRLETALRDAAGPMRREQSERLLGAIDEARRYAAILRSGIA